MGIQDRDWYWEERAKKERAALRSRRAAPDHEADEYGLPKTPPKLWGADWHWSLQLLVWLCIVTLLLAIFRMLR